MKTPLRMCCVCRKMFPQTELIRITKTKDNVIQVNKGKQKIFGRSAYLCNNKECHSTLVKKRVLNRAFKQEVPQRIYDELTNEC